MAHPLTLASSRALLFRAPLAEFVAERKRLSLELKTAGDKEGAKALLEIAKPSASAWAVNQLHWQDKPALDAMFAAAATLRKGDFGATSAHQVAIAKLRALAAKHLEAGGHSATDALLRRVTTTLAALAAAGSFAPDSPGELVADRDPPGFEAFGAATLPALHPPANTASTEKAAPVHHLAARRESEAKRQDEARRQAEEARRQAEEAHRREQEAKRLAAERARLTAALEKAREERKAREHEAAAAKKALALAEAAAERARTAEEKLAARLGALESAGA